MRQLCASRCDHSRGLLGLCEAHAYPRPENKHVLCGCPHPSPTLTSEQVRAISDGQVHSVAWLNGRLYIDGNAGP